MTMTAKHFFGLPDLADVVKCIYDYDSITLTCYHTDQAMKMYNGLQYHSYSLLKFIKITICQHHATFHTTAHRI